MVLSIKNVLTEILHEFFSPRTLHVPPISQSIWFDRSMFHCIWITNLCQGNYLYGK